MELVMCKFKLVICFVLPFLHIGLYAQVLNIGKNINVSVETGFEYNTWKPQKADELNYDIEGFQIGYAKGAIQHQIPFLPDLKFNWETNFGAKHQDEILRIHNTKSKVEQGYDKLNAILGFGSQTKRIKKGDDEVELKYDDGSTRTYYGFELSYTKETFYIGVTPATGGLNYAAYYSNRTYGFPEGTKVSQLTKFQEISATGYTNGQLFIFWIINVFFAASADQDSKMDDQSMIFKIPEADSRIGVFYATFQKPYSVSQVLTLGEISNAPNTIYNTRFRAVGIKDEISAPSRSSLIARWTNRFGFSWINLRKKESLDDTNSPGFFYFGSELELGFRLKIKRLQLSLSASGDFGFMQGLNIDDEADQFYATSFINNDLLLKYKGSLQYVF